MKNTMSNSRKNPLDLNVIPTENYRRYDRDSKNLQGSKGMKGSCSRSSTKNFQSKRVTKISQSSRDAKNFLGKSRRSNGHSKAGLYTAAVFSLLIILSIAISIKFTSHAENTCEYNYISIRIEAGDTVNGIASKHLNNTYMNHTQLAEEIIRINRLSEDLLTEGAYIVVPVADN